MSIAPAGKFKVKYAPAMVAAIEGILGRNSVVPVMQVLAASTTAEQPPAPAGSRGRIVPFPGAAVPV